MPALLRLQLIGPSALQQSVEYRHANGLRALVYDSLARVAPDFAQAMHEDTWPKPLTISPLWRRGDGWEVEIAVLLDEIGRLLLEGLAAQGTAVRLGREAFDLAGVELDALASVDDLLLDAPPARRLAVDFLTPTTHHESLPPEAVGGKAGKIGYPLPDPQRTITSWFHKWNSLMARLQRAPFPDELLCALRGLALARMHGETQAVRLGERQQLVGFVGSAVFELLGAPPLTAARALTVLARFANYAGTGVETLRGMGQTRARLLP